MIHQSRDLLSSLFKLSSPGYTIAMWCIPSALLCTIEVVVDGETVGDHTTAHRPLHTVFLKQIPLIMLLCTWTGLESLRPNLFNPTERIASLENIINAMRLFPKCCVVGHPSYISGSDHNICLTRHLKSKLHDIIVQVSKRFCQFYFISQTPFRKTWSSYGVLCGALITRVW